MIELTQEIIEKLETMERLVNERGFSLEDGLQNYINNTYGDEFKLKTSPEIPIITKEIWEVLNALNEECKKKNYNIINVLYRVSGDLWDKRISNSTIVSLSETNIERIKRIRNGMIQRCTNPNNQHYASYGARGVEVCYEWLNDSNSFIRWSSENGYADYLTLDRIDPYGNYEPSNCRWATTFTQANNKRDTKKNKPQPLVYEHRDYSPKMLARLMHLDYNELLKNLKHRTVRWAILYSEAQEFWGKEQGTIHQEKKYEERLYNHMESQFRYTYDCLVRSCVANDVDIYDLLKSLLGDIEKSPIQEKQESIFTPIPRLGA